MVALADPKAAGAAAVAIAKLAGGDFAADSAMAASAAAATMAATNSKASGADKSIKGDVAGTHLVLKNPVVGQLLARRMNFSLKLDEERLAALLASNPQAAHDGKLLGLLMACYGGLFSTALDVGQSSVDLNVPVAPEQMQLIECIPFNVSAAPDPMHLPLLVQRISSKTLAPDQMHLLLLISRICCS
ncbi:hypothetical protein DUNSADRAFT_13150 [Dunaliella salina]|uniref:Uncharacterized protein n=1 Tax=Dunaliella salina TaxID=3046 RepID=A0ABQ7G9Z0_DUNSA|nr:hypothetical protein DUNSADRAFT_13150 [Dunaliella salina]|eukprot:KAF5831415.1 hypothetical protein DUNSADRAFT_13150 [Dunaliella salina]